MPRLAMLVAATAIALCPAVWPAQAETPLPAAPASPSPLQPGDAFGEPVTLPERTILYYRGHGDWATAFETLVDAFRSLNDYVTVQKIATTGAPMTIYTQTDKAGFQFLAALPIGESPKDPPQGDIAVGAAPSGKAFKFTHRGSFEAMDTTYEAITNFLDEKQLDAKESFIEEYVDGPPKATDSQLVVIVYVPVK